MNGEVTNDIGNFWAKLDHNHPIKLHHYGKLNDVFQPENHEQSQPHSSEEKNTVEQKSQQQINNKDTELPEAKTNEIAKEKQEKKNTFIQNIAPIGKEARVELDLTATLSDQLYEDVTNHQLLWKTKWHFPAITIKPNAKSPEVSTEKIYFDIFLVEDSKQTNEFHVVYDGVKGATRKCIQNGILEYRNIRLNQRGNSEFHRLLIMAFIIQDEGTSKIRKNYDIFLSEKFIVYTEGEVILIDKADSMISYFQFFYPDVLDKPIRPKSQETESELKSFINYIFKKSTRIKNVVFLANKFPSVVELYGNSSAFKKQNGQLIGNVCQMIHTFSQDIDGSGSSPVANYLNPSAKLVMKICCPAQKLKIIINKSFTSMLSIIVGDGIQIPDHFVKLSDPKMLKDSYLEYTMKLENEKKHERKGKKQAQTIDYDEEDDEDQEEESEDGDESFDEEGTLQNNPELNRKSNDDTQRMKNRREFDEKKKPEKRNDLSYTENAKPPKRRGRKNDEDEESSFDENEESGSPINTRSKKPTRIAILADMKKSSNKDKLKTKNDEKTKEVQNKAGQWTRGPIPVIPAGGTMPMNPLIMPFPGQGAPKTTNPPATPVVGMPGNPGVKMMGMPMSMMGMMNPMGGAQGFPGGMPIQLTPDMIKMMQQQQQQQQNKSAQSKPGSTEQQQKSATEGQKPPGQNFIMMSGMPGMGGMPGMAGMAAMPGMPGMAGIAGMQGMAGMAGMQGMQMPSMTGMPAGMVPQGMMMGGMNGMMFPQGMMAAQGANGQNPSGMPYIIMSQGSNPMGALQMQRPPSASDQTRKDGEKDKQGDKKTEKSSTGGSQTQPQPTAPFGANMQLNPALLQQMMAGGMGGLPQNMIQMNPQGMFQPAFMPAGMMQGQMQGQPMMSALMQGMQGMQGLQGIQGMPQGQGGMPAMGIPMQFGMQGGQFQMSPEAMGMMQGGQGSFMAPGGMNQAFMLQAMGMPKPNSQDQNKAGSAEECKSKDAQNSQKQALDKSNVQSADKSTNPQAQQRAGFPGMPPGAMFMSPNGAGMQGMMMNPQQQMMMGNPMMQFAVMNPQQGQGNASQGQQGMNLQNLQNMAMNQLGQISMSTHQVPFQGGLPVGINPNMMQGMTLPAMNFAVNQGQRGSAPTDKKKSDQKK